MDAVLFDLFGTLIPNVSPTRLRAGLDELADALGVDRDAKFMTLATARIGTTDW